MPSSVLYSNKCCPGRCWQDRTILAGWVHYLAFDFFIGCWMVIDAAERGIKHLLVVPCLVLTFMFGPAGLLLYVGLRAATSASLAKPAAG